MPNKTIYVSDADLPLYQRAQELAGDNLSSAIANALRRWVDVEESRRDGFGEIVVRVGLEKGRKVRFVGVLLGEFTSSTWSGAETFHVYQGRTGKFVVHTERTPEWRALDEHGKPAGILGQLGIGRANHTFKPGESTLDIVPTLDEVRELVPPQLFETVARSATQPSVEDLDI